MGKGVGGVGEKGTGATTITIRNVSKTNPTITPTTIHASGLTADIAVTAVLPSPNTVFPVL